MPKCLKKELHGRKGRNMKFLGSIIHKLTRVFGKYLRRRYEQLKHILWEQGGTQAISLEPFDDELIFALVGIFERKLLIFTLA